MRLYINDNRISTAVKTKKGSILQVYPAKAAFADEVAWQNYWADAMKPKITLRFGSQEERSAPAPAPKPKAASLDDWNFTNRRNPTFAVPAGTYYIGDLCYALSDDIYDNIFGGTGYEPGVYEEKGTGRIFGLARTAYGDGEYPASDGNKFAVDAGIIGICPQSLMSKRGRGGHFYTFDTPLQCSFKNGRFSFEWEPYNSLVIDTTGDDDAY